MSEEHIDTIDYAMDALDDLSRRRADQHLEHCAQCRAEVAEWREATAGLASFAEPVAPPAGLRDAVLADVSRLPQEAPPDTPEGARPETPAAHLARRERTRRHPGRFLLAAAAAVVVIGGGVTVATHPWDNQPTTVSAIQQVEHASDAQRATAPAGDGSLVMVTSAAEGKAVATLRGVPAAAAGKVYQAWIITADGPVSAGLLQPGKATLLQGSITGAKAAAVTVEPSGGSKHPTTAPIATVTMT